MNPEDINALSESGRLKFQLGQPRYIEAIADLERARKLGLADARSFYYLGSMYQAVGLYDFAAQEYRKFLNNFPGDSEARMLLAKLCYAAGDYPGAVREFEKLLNDGSRDPVLLENLLLARWKNGQDYSKPLSELRARGAAGAFMADYAEGRVKYELKDYAGAQALLKKAVEEAPAGAFVDQASSSGWRGIRPTGRRTRTRPPSTYRADDGRPRARGGPQPARQDRQGQRGRGESAKAKSAKKKK